MRSWISRFIVATAVCWSHTAFAHDLQIAVDDIVRTANDIETTVARYQSAPPTPVAPRTLDEHRSVIGDAEIEAALGNHDLALRKLLARIYDSRFRDAPQQVNALNFAAELLERKDETTGAMVLAKDALSMGGTPAQMAVAGARWFRLARREQRTHGLVDALKLWQQREGLGVGDTFAAQGAVYEAARALGDQGQYTEALRLLASIPSASLFGSRAAYLAGVTFVKSGDLVNAERWFSALMAWPIPQSLSSRRAQERIELDVRELAALSAARLLYERGDLDRADEAYARVAEDSRDLAHACHERAYLALEKKRLRRAMIHLQCATDVGAGGERAIQLRLFDASLFAHLGQHELSLKRYGELEKSLLSWRKVLGETFANVSDPAAFLFDGMERNAAYSGSMATPGPGTVFADAWTVDVDFAYRLVRDVEHSVAGAQAISKEANDIRTLLENEGAFVPIVERQDNLRRILREIDHIHGHSVELLTSARAGHATAGGATETTHDSDRTRVLEALGRLDVARKSAEAQLSSLAQDERERRQTVDKTLSELSRELDGIQVLAASLKTEIDRVGDAVARASLVGILDSLDHAIMRARSGVLDSFWVRKERVSTKLQAAAQADEERKKVLAEALSESEQ